MWRLVDQSLRFELGDKSIIFPCFYPDWENFSGEIIDIPTPKGSYRGYDDWVRCFDRGDEVSRVKNCLVSKKRSHIRGITTAESVALLQKYYSEKGYEEKASKYFHIPVSEPITCSLLLPQVLWCEKDKHFLHTTDIVSSLPPLRSPHDLRALQQALRMGLCAGLEVGEYDAFLPLLLEKQIVTPYQMAFFSGASWDIYDFYGSKGECQCPMITF